MLCKAHVFETAAKWMTLLVIITSEYGMPTIDRIHQNIILADSKFV